MKQNRTILDSSETQNNKEALSNDSDVNENEIQVTVFDIHPEVDEPLHGSSETSDNTADRKLSPHTRDDQNCEVGLSDGKEPNNDSTTPFRGDVTLMEPKWMKALQAVIAQMRQEFRVFQKQVCYGIAGEYNNQNLIRGKWSFHEN